MIEVRPDADPYAPIADLYAAEHDLWVDDIPMYLALAERTSGPILDLACGTGRVGLHLAEANNEVHGLDVSGALLTIAQKRFHERSVQIELRQGDMRNLPDSPKFGAVFCALDSFLHLTSMEEQLTTLVGVRRVLEPGGFLALDVFNPTIDRLTTNDGALQTHGCFIGPDNAHVTHFVSWEIDPGTQQIDATHFYDVVGTNGDLCRHFTQMKLKYIYRFELELALRCAGFTHIEVYNSPALDPFDGLQDRLVIVAN